MSNVSLSIMVMKTIMSYFTLKMLEQLSNNNEWIYIKNV